MLLGIAFLTSGDSGPRLVYRYPPHSNKQSNNDQDTQSLNSVDDIIPSSSGNSPNNQSINQSIHQSMHQSLQQSSEPDVWGLRESEFTRLLTPVKSLEGEVRDLAVDTVRYLSSSVRLPSESLHELHVFTIVFICDMNAKLKPRRIDGNDWEAAPVSQYEGAEWSNHALCEQLSSQYASILQRLGRAFEHEQYRCAFVSAQAHIIQTIKEQHLNDNSSIQSINSINQLICQASILARHLFDVYTGAKQLEYNFYEAINQSINQSDCSTMVLTDDTHVTVAVNEWLKVDFSVMPALTTNVLIRPYQTLLLTSSKSTLRSSLPVDSSPLLSLLIAHVNPARSLISIASDLSLPLGPLLSMAKHLVEWGKARIIDTLDEAHRYVPRPQTITLSMSHDFSHLFPGSSLTLFLSSLHPPICLHDHLARYSSEAKDTFIRQIVWCLERDCIEQVHTFVYDLSDDHDDVNLRVVTDEIEVDDGQREYWKDSQWLRFIAHRWGDGSACLNEIAWQLRHDLSRKRLETIIDSEEDALAVVQRTTR